MDDEIYFGLQNKEQFDKRLQEFQLSAKGKQIKKDPHVSTISSQDNISIQQKKKQPMRESISFQGGKFSQMSTTFGTPIKSSISIKKSKSFLQKKLSERLLDEPKLTHVEGDIYMDVFSQQIQILVNKCWDSSDAQRKEAEKISQELGIPFAKICAQATPELREDLIIKILQEQVKDSLNQQKERMNQKSFQSPTTKDDNDIYQWLEVQSKFISLKEKLKFALVEAVNDRENQEQLIKQLDDTKGNISITNKADIKNYPKPDTRNIINELTNLLNQVRLKKFTSLVSSKQDNIEADRLHRIQREAQQKQESEQDAIVWQKLEFTSKWDDEKEKTFKNKRASAKERLSKLIKSSSWNQLGCVEFVKLYNDQSTYTFQRDTLLDKYSNGQQLSTQEFLYLSNTSQLLNRCCDKKYIQQAVALLDDKIINDIELFIAENILKHYYNLLKITKQQRLNWIQIRTNEKKKINVFKDKEFEKQNKIDSCNEQNMRLKKKLIAMLSIVNRHQQQQSKIQTQQQNFLYKEMQLGNQYANPLVWKFKDILMAAVVKRKKLLKESKDKTQQFLDRLGNSREEKCLFEVKGAEFTVSHCKRQYHPSSKLMIKNLDSEIQLKAKKTKAQLLQENQKQVKSYKLNIRKRAFEQDQDKFQEFYSGGPNKRRPYASKIKTQNSYSYGESDIPYKGSWITPQVEIAAANKIKSAIKSYIQRKKYNMILLGAKQTMQKQEDQKILKYLNSRANMEYNYKSRNTSVSTLEPSITAAFKNFKEKMSVTVKKNLEEDKLNKKDFYQELKKLGVNQPNQYKRIVLTGQTKIASRAVQPLSVKQRKLFSAVKLSNLQWIKDSGFTYSEYDVNAHDVDGKSPLYYAALKGHDDFCYFLINQGADCNMICSDGNTPVHAAFTSNNLLILNLFLQNGADINITNSLGHTPLHYGNLKRLQELNLANQVATRKGKTQADNNQINKPTFVKVDDIWDQGVDVKHDKLNKVNRRNSQDIK